MIEIEQATKNSSPCVGAHGEENKGKLKGSDMMQRAALYIRVSTEEQARSGLSLGDQERDLTSYAKEHNMKVVDIYRDAGISARKSYKRRPELLRLLDDCKDGKIDIILFIKLDRWFRNVGNYYAVQDILDQYGVIWQATQEDYETRTSAGRLKVNIMLSVAQDEADRTSERIKFVFEGKRERREPLTGNTPTGYKIEGKALVKDPDTEEAVSAFFQKYLACGSISETQRYVLEEYGLRIEYQLASKMLNSPAYYGFYYDVPDMCPAYITKEQFDKIQSMRIRVVRKSTTNRFYILSGLIVCGECNARMGGRTNTRGNTPYYNCPGHYIKRSGCENRVNISERKIIRYIVDTLDAKFEQYKIEFEKISSAHKEKNYKSEIASLQSKVSKLKDLYLNDLISLDEYKEDLKSFTSRIDELKKKEQPIKRPNFEKISRLLSSDWKANYQDLSPQEQREFWRIVIQEIRIYPDRHIEYDIAF